MKLIMENGTGGEIEQVMAQLSTGNLILNKQASGEDAQ